MRRLFYPLVAVLCLYASNCYAQLSQAEISKAQDIKTEFEAKYWVQKNELQKDLEEAKRSKAAGTRLNLPGDCRPKVRQIYNEKVKVLSDFHQKDKRNRQVNTWYKKQKQRWAKLDRLCKEIISIKRSF